MKWKLLVIAGAAAIALAVAVSAAGKGLFVRPASMNASELPTIIVDAGHGGIDGGAVGADGTIEKGINLSIAKHLEQTLRALGFEVVMTRTDDTLIGNNNAKTVREQKSSDIKRRLQMTEQYDNALLISIHQNKYSVEKYYGAQVFYSPNGEQSKQLAELVQQSVVTRLQPENERVIKPSGKEIYLLYHAGIPSVMVECGFLSNRAELQKLKSEEYQHQMSFSIACGILDYCQAG